MFHLPVFFLGFYHSNSPFFTTIWDNTYFFLHFQLPTTLSKSKCLKMLISSLKKHDGLSIPQFSQKFAIPDAARDLHGTGIFTYMYTFDIFNGKFRQNIPTVPWILWG